jgi:hypothetical protein
MQKLSSLSIVAIFLIGAACMLTPAATPATGGGPVDTPTATGGTPVVAQDTPIPTTPDLPTVTPSPTIPAGFFPIAVGFENNKEMAALLGGTENGVWIDAATTAARLSGGEVYNLFSPAGAAGSASGTKPTREMICGTYSLQWTPPPSESFLVGVGGNWNALPRIPEEPPISDFDRYHHAAQDWLESQGDSGGEGFRLSRILLVDLDGDGDREALISGTRMTENTGHDVAAGDFSFALVYDETVPQTFVLAGEYYPAAQSLVFPKVYSFVSILDLNGDGRMEVLVEVFRWEGGGTMVFEYDGSGVGKIFDSVCSL